MKLHHLAFVAFSGVIAAYATEGCKNAASVLSADNVAIDLTDTICAPLENQTAGQPYVDFLCVLAEGAESIIASIETTPDAGLTAAPSVKSVKVRVPAAEAAGFMLAHRKASKDAGIGK